ncbi:MAG TPA: N-6 DNA methylase [Pseudonocardiaceae bacterium]|nr:N-6 DNA methylase [Pseudonocardiaceae bacterium]
MAEDTAVTAADIARLAGVGRAAVSNWRRRFGDFPPPVGGTDTSPTFKLADIYEWLRVQGKLAAVSSRELVWQQLEALAGGYPVAGVLAAAGDHLANKSGRSQLDAATRHALDDFAASEGREEAFEQLCDRFVDASSRQLAVTPPELARLMVALAWPLCGVVLDPACGTGTLLREAVIAGQSDVRVHGQEADPALAELTAARLAFRATEAKIRTGDSLRQDTFADLIADTVFCNPPFNYRNWGFEDLSYDPRWAYGMPPKGESELAWVQHCLAHLRPGGSAVLLMPPAVASRRSGRPIRAELLRRGALRAVIALPAGAAPPLGVPLHLWVLRRPAEPVGYAGLLLVDSTGGEPGRLDDLGWPMVTKRVLTAWRDVDGVSGSEPGLHKVIPAIDLLDDEVDLTPSRHLRPVANLSGLSESRQSLSALLGQLPNLLPEAVPVDLDPDQRAMISIAALARSGALALHQQIVALKTSDDGTGPLVLTTRDVVTGRGPSTRLAEDLEPAGTVLRVGDIVVPMIAPHPVAVAITEGGALLGSQLFLVRADPDHLDPWFLAGFLRSRDVLRYSTSVSGTHRFDVRKVEVPRLPLAEQRRYGDAFRRLAQFESRLGRAAALGRDFTQSMTDGLVLGVLSPAPSPGE